MKVFVFDLDKCNGCHNCQIACKDEHAGNDWSPYALPQPDTGQFWCKVDEEVCGKVPHVRVNYLPRLCNHCDEAPCRAASPEEVRKRDDGLVLIDPAEAGARELVDACPYGAIFWNEELGIAQKCTGCAHLLDDGWAEPRCVDACPTGALSFGEEGALDLKGAEPLGPLVGLGAHAWYKNLPKRFVAGCLVDFDSREVVVDAEAVLVDEAGTEVARVPTDDFGDFLFDQVEPAAYTVRVAGRELAADVREKDLNLGDIALR